MLDEWGGTKHSHAEIARWLVEEHAVEEWWAQTINVAVQAVFEAFANASKRAEWLPNAQLVPTTVNPPKSYRAEWEDDTRIAVWLTEKNNNKTGVSVQHEKLPDGDAAAAKKSYWRDRLNDLKAILEG